MANRFVPSSYTVRFSSLSSLVSALGHLGVLMYWSEITGDFSYKWVLDLCLHYCRYKQNGSCTVNEQCVLRSYPEELLSRAWVQCPIGYLCLFGQVLCTLYGWDHPLHSEKGSQIGCVRGDDDKGKEPPHTSNNTSRQRPGEKSEYEAERCRRYQER